MQYDRYMALGLPIGIWVIEGTCKNLINDRMERSGTRWFLDGAEVIFKLRAVHLSNLWDEFWVFRTDRERRVLYGEQGSMMKQPSSQHDVANAV
jgi:hypothetical protein